MRHDFQTQPGFFMMNINKWSILYLGIAMCISEEVLDFFKFIQENPVALYYLSIITVCCAIGQTFIYLMISHFGTLSCTIVTTTRKFFTILGSIIIFRHSMTPLQWVATCLVFLGLLLDTYYSNRECNEKSNRNSTYMHTGLISTL
ncbi:solute carrier family 35 member B1-like [Diaphorina citri]|uniref:Solute carrier family 35 member B1-like n=1 Tax=Diaphorina citri TaxID=121845 RepID=A0A1S3DRY7_DIACI|nr:solute carrier family 35 member B1-like [Diaphorina citri]